jgi:chitinase
MAASSFLHRLRMAVVVGMCTILSVVACQRSVAGERAGKLLVIAYVHGAAEDLEQYPLQYLTHINYSFLHLKGNRLAPDRAQDTARIERIVALKKKYPGLKVNLSLGGWGGCETCSDVFRTETGRREFAASAKELLVHFGADGIDLDWEYPAIEGVPGHTYRDEDKQSFTLLISEMRKQFGDRYEITFAAGGYGAYFQKSVEWDKVMPLVDYVNIMSYDLVSGNAVVTGHHTALYSTPEQEPSVASGIRTLDSLGVPRNKIVIGAAFYARVWSDVDSVNHGLYRPGTFTAFAGYREFEERLWKGHEYVQYWDSTACAPYAYDAKNKLYATYDDPRSVAMKTKFAIEKGLRGIMFWELSGDVTGEEGLLGVIGKLARSQTK